MTTRKPNTAAKLPPQKKGDAVQWPADSVERRPVESLARYAHNARTHSPEQVAQIAASIQKWGWTMPVLVDEDGTLIAGHGRVMAAQKLGLAAVPTMVARGWTDAQKRAYRIADNQLALNAGWDKAMLGMELGGLKADGFDLGLMGFDPNALRQFMAVPKTDPDEAPPAPLEPVSRTGDLWLLGGHRVLCGDSTKVEDVARVTGRSKLDLMVTDPPYGVDFERGKYVGRTKAATGPSYDPIANDELKGDALADFVGSVLALAHKAGADGMSAYVFAPALLEGAAILQAMVGAEFRVQSQLIWRKSPFVIGQADYHWQHENCWYGFKAGKHQWFGGRDKGTVIDCPKPSKADLHPTMKPVDLLVGFIVNSSAPGNLIYDPFLGSGTTLIAAEQEGRVCSGLELHPPYVDVIIKRWQAYTGQAATLEGAGRTFVEIAAERLEGATCAA